MDNVSIGLDCVIENCIISSEVNVEDSCHLTKCNFGKGVTVLKGLKLSDKNRAVDG